MVELEWDEHGDKDTHTERQIHERLRRPGSPAFRLKQRRISVLRRVWWWIILCIQLEVVDVGRLD